MVSSVISDHSGGCIDGEPSIIRSCSTVFVLKEICEHAVLWVSINVGWNCGHSLGSCYYSILLNDVYNVRWLGSDNYWWASYCDGECWCGGDQDSSIGSVSVLHLEGGPGRWNIYVNRNASISINRRPSSSISWGCPTFKQHEAKSALSMCAWFCQVLCSCSCSVSVVML